MASHSSMLAWEIPRTEEPGRLQSMGWQRGGSNSAVRLNQVNTIYSKVASSLSASILFQFISKIGFYALS